jgi:hypothetical protein
MRGSKVLTLQEVEWVICIKDGDREMPQPPEEAKDDACKQGIIVGK